MRSNPFHRYPPALQIACPSCGARPAQPCRSSRKATSDRPHEQRRRLAEQGRTRRYIPPPTR